MNLKTILIVSALSVVGAAHADIIASWTFETSVPTTAGPFAPEVGSGSALGFHANSAAVYSNPVGNGSAESFSSNNWSVGDYYQFTVSSAGLADLSISFDQISSGTGPKDFALSYSTDGTSFTQFAAYTVIVNTAPNTWGSATPTTASSYSYDLGSIAGLDNQSSVAFRLVDLSTTSANGGTVALAGTSRVDNVTISAAPVPEPASMAVLALGAAGLLRRRRSAK